MASVLFLMKIWIYYIWLIDRVHSVHCSMFSVDAYKRKINISPWLALFFLFICRMKNKIKQRNLFRRMPTKILHFCLARIQTENNRTFRRFHFIHSYTLVNLPNRVRTVWDVTFFFSLLLLISFSVLLLMMIYFFVRFSFSSLQFAWSVSGENKRKMSMENVNENKK